MNDYSVTNYKYFLVRPFSEAILYSRWRERFVLCPEYRGLKYTIYMEIAVGATACVRYLEVVRFSEGPLRYYCRGNFERKGSDQLLVINKGVWPMKPYM